MSRDAFPSIHVAMAMDGGSSSDIRVSEALWRHRDLTQQQSAWKDLFVEPLPLTSLSLR